MFLIIWMIFAVSSASRCAGQEKKKCPVSFEKQNYYIITSQCKGPQYITTRCCDAYKEFVCPFSRYINNMSTDCAGILQNYINLAGKYPPNLFASLCQDEKTGLRCNLTAPPPSVSAPSCTASLIKREISWWLRVCLVWLLRLI